MCVVDTDKDNYIIIISFLSTITFALGSKELHSIQDHQEKTGTLPPIQLDMCIISSLVVSL